jgi:hypothetical protein
MRNTLKESTREELETLLLNSTYCQWYSANANRWIRIPKKYVHRNVWNTKGK